MPRPKAGMPMARTRRSSIGAAGSRPAGPASAAPDPASAGSARLAAVTGGTGSDMDASKVNYLAALVAALSSFLIGGLWYSPILFAKAWMRETGLTDEQLRSGVVRTFATAFVLSLVMALNLGFFLGPRA